MSVVLMGASSEINTILGFGVGSVVYGHVGRVESLRLGPLTIEAPVASFPTTAKGAHAQSSFAGSIGVEVLRRFHLILDCPRQRIILQKNAHLDTPYEHDMSGVVLTRAREHLRVETVTTGARPPKRGCRSGI